MWLSGRLPPCGWCRACQPQAQPANERSVQFAGLPHRTGSTSRHRSRVLMWLRALAGIAPACHHCSSAPHLQLKAQLRLKDVRLRCLPYLPQAGD